MPDMIDLKASASDLLGLTANVARFGLDDPGDPFRGAAWFSVEGGPAYIVGVDEINVAPGADASTLGIVTMESLLERARRRPPVSVKARRIIEEAGGVLSEDLAVPPHLRPWPFRRWRSDVVIEKWSEGCSLAVGLLFRGECGRQILVAADYPVLLTERRERIAEFISGCTLVDVRSYAARLA